MFNDSHVEMLRPQSLNPIKEHMLMSPVNIDQIDDYNKGLKKQYNLD